MSRSSVEFGGWCTTEQGRIRCDGLSEPRLRHRIRSCLHCRRFRSSQDLREPMHGRPRLLPFRRLLRRRQAGRVLIATIVRQRRRSGATGGDHIKINEKKRIILGRDAEEEKIYIYIVYLFELTHSLNEDALGCVMFFSFFLFLYHCYEHLLLLLMLLWLRM